MTRVDALEANLLAVVRLVEDLQQQIKALEHVCRVQDQTILVLNERLERVEHANDI